MIVLANQSMEPSKNIINFRTSVEQRKIKIKARERAKEDEYYRNVILSFQPPLPLLSPSLTTYRVNAIKLNLITSLPTRHLLALLLTTYSISPSSSPFPPLIRRSHPHSCPAPLPRNHHLPIHPLLTHSLPLSLKIFQLSSPSPVRFPHLPQYKVLQRSLCLGRPGFSRS